MQSIRSDHVLKKCASCHYSKDRQRYEIISGHSKQKKTPAVNIDIQASISNNKVSNVEQLMFIYDLHEIGECCST